MASCSFALFGAATEEKLKKTQTRFDDWIDGQSAALSLAPDKTTPVETRYFLWDKWVIGYDLPSCRSAICSTVLIRSNPCLSTNEADNPVDPVLEKLYAAYLPLEYAYQQGLFRHSKKFPGVEDGNPPTILGIRGISHAGKEKIFSQSEEDGLHDYPASTQLAAESWGMGGGANAFLGKNRSNPAVFKDNAVFWGKIPIYAVLTSDPIQAQKDGHGWHHAQREMVVLATDDRTVELRQKMPWEEYRGITYEQLHRQYGDNLPYCPEVHENGWVDYVNKKN
jgi:hypothetical protein